MTRICFRKILIHRKALSVVTILLLGLLSVTWFRGNFLIDNFDIDFPLNASQGIIRTLYTWNINNAIGSYDPLTISSIFPFQILWSFLGNLFSLVLSEKILFYLLFCGSGLSMYFLTSTLIKGNKREICGLISAIFYMLNPFSLTFIWPQLTTFIFLYTFLPLFLCLFIKGLNSKNVFRSAFLTCVILLLTMSSAFQNPRFIVIAWTPILLYLCFHILTTKDVVRPLRFTFLLFILWFAMSAFWLIPSIGYINTNYNALSYAAIGLSDLSAFIINSAPIIGVMRLGGYWALSSGFGGDLYYTWAPIYSSVLFIFISFLMVILAFLPLLVNKKDKHILYFALLSILGFFIVKGPNPPLGEINLWLTSNISLLARLFRHNYEYFGVFIPLSYAFLIGNSLTLFFSSGRTKAVKNFHVSSRRLASGKLIKILAGGVIIIVLFGVYAWPFWNGDVVRQTGSVLPSSRVKIPEYYYNAANWLSSQNDDFRILSQPISESSNYANFWWNNGSEGYSGANPLPWLLPKPTIVSYQSGQDLSEFTIQNLLATAEAGFETGLNVFQSSGDNYLISIQNETAYEGTHSLKITFSDDGGKAQLTANEALPVQPYQNFTFSAYVKTSTQIGETLIGVNFYDQKMREVTEEQHSANYDGNYNWTKLTFTTIIPEGVSYVKPTFVFSSDMVGSDVYIDNYYPYGYWTQISNASKILSILNVKYIMLCNDANWPLISGYPSYISNSPEIFQSILSSQPGLYLEKTFGQLDFYSNEYWEPLHVYAAIKCVVVNNVSEMVQAIQEKSFVPESSILVLSNQLKLYPSIPFKSEINNNVYFSFEKINPVKYSIHVNASEPFYLVFSESYDNGWVATINGQQVPDQYHFTANGYANGWYINKTGTYTVTLEFTPQNLFYAGAAVSITSLIICTVYFSKNKIKNIYQKHVKKNKVSN